MAKYIEYEAAIAYAPLPKHLREYQTMNLDDAWEDGYDFAIRQIESIPSADVAEVRHGKWVNGKCSECGGDAPFWPMATTYYRSNFCPNCGADMREANDGI